MIYKKPEKSGIVVSAEAVTILRNLTVEYHLASMIYLNLMGEIDYLGCVFPTYDIFTQYLPKKYKSETKIEEALKYLHEHKYIRRLPLPDKSFIYVVNPDHIYLTTENEELDKELYPKRQYLFNVDVGELGASFYPSFKEKPSEIALTIADFMLYKRACISDDDLKLVKEKLESQLKPDFPDF
jgi:hypothetical protein